MEFWRTPKASKLVKAIGALGTAVDQVTVAFARLSVGLAGLLRPYPWRPPLPLRRDQMADQRRTVSISLYNSGNIMWTGVMESGSVLHLPVPAMVVDTIMVQAEHPPMDFRTFHDPIDSTYAVPITDLRVQDSGALDIGHPNRPQIFAVKEIKDEHDKQVEKLQAEIDRLRDLLVEHELGVIAPIREP